MRFRACFVRVCILVLLCAACPSIAIAAEPARPPNIVLIFCDDMGYADIGSFGGNIKTPNLDRFASEGVRFTDFCVPTAVCSASRAAILTGCYPNRIGIHGALPPRSKVGISDKETTLAQMLKARGYATGMVGKWHLGDAPQFLPTRHGFDEWLGIPYSHDMWPKHPTTKTFPDLPLMENEKVLRLNPEPGELTTLYTERAVQFIQKSKDKPFFLYLAHNLPHVPLGVSDKFAGKSGQGLYGDVIQEIDWSVGQVMETIKKAGIDEQTMVIFTSDNGPWLLYGNHAGSAGPLREGKATSMDGGIREPCLMRWPGKIPAGTVQKQLALSMDLLPTIARLTGAETPKDHIIDGLDMWPLITSQPDAKPPHEALFVYWNGELQAVRSGPWKLHLGHTYVKPNPPGADAKPGKYSTEKIGVELFDMEADPSETKDVASANPDVVEKLQALAEKCREDLGDAKTKRIGKNVREPGRLPPAAVEKN